MPKPTPKPKLLPIFTNDPELAKRPGWAPVPKSTTRAPTAGPKPGEEWYEQDPRVPVARQAITIMSVDEKAGTAAITRPCHKTQVVRTVKLARFTGARGVYGRTPREYEG